VQDLLVGFELGDQDVPGIPGGFKRFWLLSGSRVVTVGREAGNAPR
jgi:hypothetical protein